MKRHLVGAAALLILAIGLWLLWQGTHSSGQELLMGSCLRIGCVLAVLWVAWPDLARLPPFLCFVGGISLLIMLKWPRLVVYVLPVLVVLWVLRPRRGSSSRPLTTQAKSRSRDAQTSDKHDGSQP